VAPGGGERLRLRCGLERCWPFNAKNTKDAKILAIGQALNYSAAQSAAITLRTTRHRTILILGVLGAKIHTLANALSMS
jgi:hypothetical protein